MGKLDLTGQRFGRLVVLGEAGQDAHKHFLWRCKCDCGNECIAQSGNLKSGNTSSCGCLQRERASVTCTKHGKQTHPLYRTWRNILVRTGVYSGASARVKRDYIERGITIAKEWLDFEKFYTWATTHGWKDGLQIDRIDNNGGYNPDNCRFVAQRENLNNRRRTHRLSDGTPLAEFVGSLGVETCVNGNSSKTYKSIERIYRKHGPDEAMMRAYGEAIASRFDGTEFVPFRKMFKA